MLGWFVWNRNSVSESFWYANTSWGMFLRTKLQPLIKQVITSSLSTLEGRGRKKITNFNDFHSARDKQVLKGSTHSIGAPTPARGKKSTSLKPGKVRMLHLPCQNTQPQVACGYTWIILSLKTILLLHTASAEPCCCLALCAPKPRSKPGDKPTCKFTWQSNVLTSNRFLLLFPSLLSKRNKTSPLLNISALFMTD